MDSSCIERPKTWKSERRGKAPNYKYKCIKEILEESSHSSICNVYGVVTDFKEPTKSKGTDHYALVFIADDTSQDSVRVRLFYGDPSFFPDVGIGDVIRFHRLKVSIRLDEVTLISTKGWSWVLWDATDPFKLEKSSSNSYTLQKADKDIVEKLRDWRGKHADEYTMGNNNFKRFSEIGIGERVCVLCKVIAFKQPDDSKLCAQVCDGTKPKVMFHRFEACTVEHGTADIPLEYVVDVALFRNHVDKWHELRVMKGSYIVLRDLHAWPNPSDEHNVTEKVCCELSLHSGTARGRAVEKAPDGDLLRTVELDIGAAGRDEVGDMSDIELDVEGGFTQLCEEPLVQDDNATVGNDAPQPSGSGRERSYSGSESNHTTNGSGLQVTSDDGTSSGTHRCLQDSLTVITGEGMPVKLSSIKTVINDDVAVDESKLYLTRVHLKSCDTPEEEYVGHFSPAIMLFYPTRNEGEPLCMDERTRLFIETWRKVRGSDQVCNSGSIEDSQPASQWDIPSVDGEIHSLDIKKYKCLKDGSEWDSVKTDDHIVRKRKSGSERFTILYILQDSGCSLENLEKFAPKYDRVIRILPLASLTSRNPPAVGIQEGVFYYCCPASAVQPTIPSLKEEAEAFTGDRISKVAGSPVLLPFFNIRVTLSDESGILENVHLSGKNAAHFFCDTSPQDFVTDKDEVMQEVKDCIGIFLRDDRVFECIIEKKCRLTVANKTPSYVYSIRNTALRSGE